jgi:hypothetical protein
MLQELEIDRKNLLVITEDIIEITHSVTILRCHRTNPTLYLRVVKRRHGDVIGGKSNHAV